MKIICSLMIAFTLLVPQAWAQEDGSEEDIVKSTQNDLVVVGAAGIGGAVLGLSTLSFYERPSKHVSNIWMGAALGIIAGVILVAVNYAQKGSEDLSGSYSPKVTPDFGTGERFAWHVQETQQSTVPSVGAPLWGTSF